MVTPAPLLAAAVSDCEAIHSGWLDQPSNAYSSLAFVAAAALVISRARSATARAFGVALALVGIGSALFHGRAGDAAGWLHDVSIVGLLVIVLLFEEDRGWAGAALVVAALAIGVSPGADEPLAVALVALIVLKEITGEPSPDRRWLAVSVALLAIGIVFTVLGRSGGPWCDPASILQPHAAWHLLAASGLLAYAVSKGWVRPPGVERG